MGYLKYLKLMNRMNAVTQVPQPPVPQFEKYCKLFVTDEEYDIMMGMKLRGNTEAELRALDPAKVAGVRRSAFGVEALVERGAARGLVCDPAGIEDIMLYYIKGDAK